MNDEINIRFGGDLTGIGTALRGLRGMAEKTGEAVKDSFKDVFHHLTAPLSIAGAFEAVHSLMEDVENIKRISESTGISTGLTQDLLNLGKAGGLAFGDIESAMDKFVKGLAPGSDPDQALANLADKIQATKDPSERARIAVEAFGRSGVKLIPILSQGAEGVQKLSEEWGKLSDAEIDQIEHANESIEKFGQRTKVLLAQVIDGFKQTGDKLKDVPLWKMIAFGPVYAVKGVIDATRDTSPSQEELDKDNATEVQKTENAKKAAQAKKESALKAAKELAEGEELLNAKPQEKVLLLTRKILELRRQMEDTDDDKERQKITEKLLSLEQQRKSVQDEVARTAKETAEKQKKIADDIYDSKKKLYDLDREREKNQMSEYMPTLQELAQSGFSYVSGSATLFQQGPFAHQAQELLRLQQDAKESLIFGNKGRFDNDTNRIEQLKTALRSAGVMSPDDRMESIDENTEKTQKHLQELLSKATGDGLNVKGPDD